ncbi:hypothetical protein JCM3775_000259 [Rhodotorula graminis]|uniref:LIM zinc-binding domain-containing protein n=1 Tax=Rhodotorula graminis (strain WP1) TaxID=578459 RepID=A0A194S715_RHOGW|nr:uncharacterized protein RHOBADRAFT_52316 [Rhodotorula graminis WP1]KPV76290.1 hypothetical protein RHOBADRAFT_52316 [Rhodotorula graminis WP1]
MASSYYVQRDAYNRSPSPLHHHRPPPPAGPSAPVSQPLRFLPPSQAHRQNTAPPAPYSHSGYAAAPHQLDHPHHRPHTASASDSEPSCIKCSSCAAWVRLEDLGGHVCAAARARDERRAPPVGLQLERGGGAGAGLNGGLSPGQYLHASPPGSAPLSFPTTSSSTSPSASTSARLGFFDRYQQLVDTSELAAGNMAGVGSARSPRLAPGGIGGGGFPHHQHPQHHPPQRSTTAPLPTSVSAPNLTVPGHAPYYPQTQQRRRPDDDGDRAPSSPGPPLSPGVGLYRQPSPTPVSARSMASEWSAAQRERAFADGGLDTPASSVAPSSSSRSRKESLPRNGTSAATPQQQQQLARAASQSSSSASSAYLAYDRFSSDSIPQSRSTPAGLGGWASTSGGTVGGGGAGTAGGLDACLEDLRLMADGEDGDVAGEETLEALFEGRRRDDEEGARRDDHDDLLATPRQAPRRRDKEPPTTAHKSPSLAPNSPLSPPPTSTSTSSAPLSCTACRTPIPPSATPKRTSAGPPFCRPCYADRFLPKCRRCALPIEGGAVTSSDGKIQGKYHPACFSCWACAAKFPSGEFYVLSGKPYCMQDYHALNGSLCADPRCGKPIEGPCVSLIGEDKGDGGRYHPPCFNCSDPSCLVPLLSHHFVVDRLPYCDVHAAGPVRRRAPRQGAAEGVEARAKKRQTIITRS